MSPLRVAALVVLVLLPGTLPAAEVYRSTGAHGETVFSDVETSDAETVVVDPPSPASTSGADWLAQTLEVANLLEASRLAREAAAAERRAAYRRQQQAPVSAPVEERIVYAPQYPYPWRPGYHPHYPPYRPVRPPHRPPRPPQGSDRPSAEPSRSAPIPMSGFRESGSRRER